MQAFGKFGGELMALEDVPLVSRRHGSTGPDHSFQTIKGGIVLLDLDLLDSRFVWCGVDEDLEICDRRRSVKI